MQPPLLKRKFGSPRSDGVVKAARTLGGGGGSSGGGSGFDASRLQVRQPLLSRKMQLRLSGLNGGEEARMPVMRAAGSLTKVARARLRR